MSETISPNPSASDGPGSLPKEKPVTSQQENGHLPQLSPYPTPNSHPNSATGPPGSQPPKSTSQQVEQQPTPRQDAELSHTTPAAQPASAPQNLPPIHAVDRPGQSAQAQQPQQPPQRPQVPAGPQMPANPSPVPQMASMNQFYSGPPATSIPHQDQMNLSTMQTVGYQGEQNKLLSGGRHKKEVKRRTKTGCLTCRKRRIKCDETHPVCRNCVKSKRECLGYDPVFRTQPAPSAIQPAPNPPPSLVVAPQNPSYPTAPPGYVPASVQPFVPSLPSESPTPSLEQLEYGTSIDPSLQTSNSPPAPPIQNTAESNLQHLQHQAAAPPPPPPAITPAAMPQPRGQKVKKVDVEDLLCLNGVPPPPKFPINPIEQSRLDGIKAVFLTYAAGADRFLETKWFQEKGMHLLMEDAQRKAQFSGLIDTFQDPNAQDPNVLARAISLEASVVWESLEICRVPEKRVASPGGTLPPLSFDQQLAMNRLRVIEALISGDYLDDNPVTMPESVALEDSSSFANQIRQREFEFWSSLGHFLTLHDGEGDAAKEIDSTLATCRSLLDTYENRDVIYSIAIARVVGQRWVDLPITSTHLNTGEDRQEAGQKLWIAQRFLEDEASGKATQKVIRYVCGMVLQAWTLSRE